jgi:hypothetical protein
MEFSNIVLFILCFKNLKVHLHGAIVVYDMMVVYNLLIYMQCVSYSQKFRVER